MTVGSVFSTSKSGSYRSKKKLNRSISASIRSRNSSSSARALMETRIAEENLKMAVREKAFATLESERAIMIAEYALVKARIRSEATQGLSDLEGEELPLSGFDKVNKYVNELPDIQSRLTPELAPVFTNLNREISTELPREGEDSAFCSQETVAQQDDVGIDSR